MTTLGRDFREEEILPSTIWERWGIARVFEAGDRYRVCYVVDDGWEPTVYHAWTCRRSSDAIEDRDRLNAVRDSIWARPARYEQVPA